MFNITINDQCLSGRVTVTAVSGRLLRKMIVARLQVFFVSLLLIDHSIAIEPGLIEKIR